MALLNMKQVTYPFEFFEQKAIEARQLLHQTYVEVIQFKNANEKFVDMGEVNFYGWKINEERIIEAKSGNCQRYLEYYSKGDYNGCAMILDGDWETKPSLIKTTK